MTAVEAVVDNLRHAWSAGATSPEFARFMMSVLLTAIARRRLGGKVRAEILRHKAAERPAATVLPPA